MVMASSLQGGVECEELGQFLGVVGSGPRGTTGGKAATSKGRRWPLRLSKIGVDVEGLGGPTDPFFGLGHTHRQDCRLTDLL